jgi:hypothetical protein
MEPCFDLAECDLNSDFDDPVDDDPMQPQPRASSDTLESPRRPINAYLVKFTAYKTLVAKSHEDHYTTNRWDVAYAQ